MPRRVRKALESSRQVHARAEAVRAEKVCGPLRRASRVESEHTREDTSSPRGALTRMLPIPLLALLPAVAAFAKSPRLQQLPSVREARSPSSLAAPSLLRHSALLMQEEEGSGLEQWFSAVKANVEEGEFGTRGEGWVAGQFGLLFGVLIAPLVPGAQVASGIAGLLLIAVGGALAAGGAYGLGSRNLTPWPKPVESNELRTDGAYSLCRHPIYGGLCVACLGLSVLSASPERLIVTLALYTLLSLKASREEELLEEVHGDAYAKWAGSVPQLLPAVTEWRKLTQLVQQD